MPVVRYSLKARLHFLLAAVVFVPTVLSAQPRRVFNPRMSTANPDLIAHERLVEDRQERTNYRISDNTTFSALLSKPAAGTILRPGLTVRGSRRSQIEVLGVDTALANFSRSPTWTRAAIGDTPQPALAYVPRDDAKGNPMYVHSLDGWLASRGIDAERVATAPVPASVNNLEVSATENKGFVRYTHVSVAGGEAVLNHYDAPNSRWADGAAAVQSGKALQDTLKATRIVRGASLPLAFVFPGAGHFAGDHKLKGLVYSTIGVASAGLLVKGLSGTSSAVADGQTAFDSKNLIANRAAHDRYNSEKSTMMIGVGALGGIWAVSLIDAAMHTKTTTAVQVIGKQSAAPTSKSSVTNVGLKIPFGSPRR